MPTTDLSRRRFLRNLATATTAASLAPSLSAEPTEAPATPSGSSGRRLRIACIGVGNRGYTAVAPLMRTEEIVALCEVDDLMMHDTLARAADEGHPELRQARRFKDYREMFAAMADQIDAVTVCTPDHHHYLAAMLALQHRKHVFVEKPLTYSVGEARALKAAARRAGVVTQMGNQGHTTEGIRLAREWFELGLLGDVREVVAWGPSLPLNFFYRPDKLPPSPGAVPGRLAWDLWLGPAPERDYAPIYHPLYWRGWWDFGNATLGDWACHTLDAPFWALQLTAPTSVEVEVSEVDPWICPKNAVVRYQFPARGALPPVKLTWHEGDAVRPPQPAQWESNEGLPDRGMLMIGDRNVLFHGGRPDSPRLLSRAAMDDIRQNRPDRWIPRIRGGPIDEWLRAIKEGGPPPGSSFDYAADLTQMALLGTVAMRTGKNFTWDNDTGRITSDPSLNRHIEIRGRNGWTIEA
jgi:predicted dehydrogenase